VGLFRRDRPLHERLATEADVDIGTMGMDVEPRAPSRLSGLVHGLLDGFLTTPPDTFGDPHPLGEVGVHGVPRARQWDVVATARADELPGNEITFAALPDGTLLVETDVELRDGVLAPLAEAVESTLAPPYRAQGVRRSEHVWAIAANRIRLRSFPDAEEDTVELVEDGTVVLGRRLDGDLFEVEETPL
jgi:hypothetical protein